MMDESLVLAVAELQYQLRRQYFYQLQHILLWWYAGSAGSAASATATVTRRTRKQRMIEGKVIRNLAPNVITSASGSSRSQPQCLRNQRNRLGPSNDEAKKVGSMKNRIGPDYILKAHRSASPCEHAYLPRATPANVRTARGMSVNSRNERDRASPSEHP